MPAGEKGFVAKTKSSTEIFIFPPCKFKTVDILLTNFHLPKSTLFMLVCAFVGKKKAFKIYSHAISQNYRFIPAAILHCYSNATFNTYCKGISSCIEQ
ncbi:MAG: hypothetical protein A2887_01535 [Alphaproteobacteria bacterium RIFCSPLOWO2_01_FULL_40_26]|nr:MAG: hypothetical protein A2794_04885 [Alphaproteobacteria bacterium RIFCSPHIGHO2_01_FULL_40_8]OFW94965.1 MAG: hypothetical protein A2887_01535 [Alphaproteobacteria bacterium RIFCSPLOWO2_01_FULL_40_26]